MMVDPRSAALCRVSRSRFITPNHGALNVDMLRAFRLLEQIVGEKLVHIESTEGLDATDIPTGSLFRLFERP